MTLPATDPEIIDAMELVLSDGAAWTLADLATALEARGLVLGEDPEAVIEDILTYDGIPLFMPLSDDRLVLLPALLRDRVLTHRVSTAEVEHGYLVAHPDLESFSLLTDEETHTHLVDGTLITDVIPGFDDGLLAERGIGPGQAGDHSWVLEPDTLRLLGISAGDLVGVTVRDDGFELSPVPTAGDATVLGATMSSRVNASGEGEPVNLDDVMWLACAQAPDLLTVPLPPLSEIVDAIGLQVRGDWLAPRDFDFQAKDTQNALDRLAEAHDLEPAEAAAVLVLSARHQQIDALLERLADAELSNRPTSDDLAEAGVAAAAEAIEARLATDDHQLVLDVLPLLASPAVAEAFALEALGADVDGAPALDVLAQSYEPRAPRASQPALRWLRGRALEREGDILEAEQVYEQALAMDRDHEPSLYSLARFASDRGDAQRGLALLARAGAPDDDPLVQRLEAYRPAPRTDLGRNDRCWCGSGRKYKLCHLNRETVPLAERARWLYNKAGDFVSDGPWRMDVLRLAELRAEHWDDELALVRALEDPLVGDTLLFEGGAFQAFLDERGTLLPADELLLAQQWLLNDRSIHEVESLSPGVGFTSRDVRTGDRHTVRERTATRSMKQGELYCCRIVPAGDTMQIFGGLELVTLHERDELISLLDSDPEPDEVVELLTRRFAPPRLSNTEGEPMVFCEATLAVEDPAALARHLDTAYRRAGDGALWHELVITDGMERIRATLVLEDTTLRVDTNSEARMDRVLDALTDPALGTRLVDQKRQPEAEVRKAMGRMPTSAEPATGPDDPAMRAVLEQYVRQYEERWLDDSIPALQGLTPREAADDPTRREDLVRLLDSLPPEDPNRPGMSRDRLRTALGL